MKAYLVLEDGSVYVGESIGAQKEVICEIVFDTAMGGVYELLTNPSCAGSGIVMSYPLVGNCGVCTKDAESGKIWAEALIVRTLAPMSSNFRKETELSKVLEENGIPGISGVDTRAVTKHLRDNGTMLGMVTCQEPNVEECVKKIKAHTEGNLVAAVSVTAPKKILHQNKKVAVLDFGAKKSLLEALTERGCDLELFPYNTQAEDIFPTRPDGILLSNGPGNPADMKAAAEEIRQMLDFEIPIFAVGLGHQVLAIAMGAQTQEMKHGHRGANYPVKDMETGRVYITAQGHGYVVKEDSLPKDASVCYRNINDQTIEGITYGTKKIISIQFYPDGGAGPKDTEFLFDKFVDWMK